MVLFITTVGDKRSTLEDLSLIINHNYTEYWKTIGLNLNISKHDLNNIEENCSGVNEICSIYMFEKLLQNKPKATLENVIAAFDFQS